MAMRHAVGVDLVSVIPLLVDVLNKVDRYPALYANKRVLRDAVRRYEHVWVPVLARAPPEQRTKLVPPLDVEWVWMCHMLCPTQYAVDSAAIWAEACPDEAQTIVGHELLSPRKREKGIKAAKALWGRMFPDEPYDVTKALASAATREGAPDGAVKSVIGYDIVSAAERQMAFHYQVCVMPQYRIAGFLKGAVERYERMFLMMQKEAPRQVWVPTYDIDAAWHAHMMHPAAYAMDTERMCGRLLPHDDTTNDRAEGATLNVRWAATREHWLTRFGEPISRDGGMWRGNVGVEERALQPEIIAEIKSLEGACDGRVEDAADFLSPAQRDAEGKVDWVHSSVARSRGAVPRGVESGDVAMRDDGYVERFSELVAPTGGGKVLRSRVVVSRVARCEASGYGAGATSYLEVYGTRGQLPLCTAHDLPAQTMVVASHGALGAFSCSYEVGEKVLVLRIGGEDFALLRGRWVGATPTRKGIPGLVPDREYETHEIFGRSGSRGCPGHLELRIWFLHPAAPEGWTTIRPGFFGDARKSQLYSMQFPRRTSNASWTGPPGRHSLKFDLLKSTVSASERTMMLPGHAIALASSMLFVSQQPWYKPRELVAAADETMYPAWTLGQKRVSILRAAGGEIVKNNRRNGYGQVLFVPNSNIFFGSTDEVGDPAGNPALFGAAGCGGCGACVGRGGACGIVGC